MATHVKGFDTFTGLLAAFAFHGLATVAGLQLLRAARGQGTAAPVAGGEES